jgi:hypothetical protein
LETKPLTSTSSFLQTYQEKIKVQKPNTFFIKKMSMFKSVLRSGGETKDSLRKHIKELEGELELEQAKTKEMENMKKELERMQQEVDMAKGETKELQAKCEGMSVRTAIVASERDRLKAEVETLKKSASSSASSDTSTIAPIAPSAVTAANPHPPHQPLTSAFYKPSKRASATDRPSVDFSHKFQVYELPPEEEEEDEEADQGEEDEAHEVWCAHVYSYIYIASLTHTHSLSQYFVLLMK